MTKSTGVGRGGDRRGLGKPVGRPPIENPDEAATRTLSFVVSASQEERIREGYAASGLSSLSAYICKKLGVSRRGKKKH